jgi:polyisoprenoid-binding protein YceI
MFSIERAAQCLIALGLSTLVFGASPAAEKVFKVGGTPAQQTVQFENVSEVETFTGKTSKVTGTIKFDPAKGSGSGKIVVSAGSLDTGFEKRNEQLWSAEWLDIKKFPTIVFETTKVARVKGDEYKATGNFTLHGVKRSVTVPVSVKYLAASAATRRSGLKGDVLQVKATFAIKMTDFGIKIPSDLLADMSPDVKITVTVYAQTGL